MTNEPTLPTKWSRLATSLLALLLIAGLSVTPALAQEEGQEQQSEEQQQLEQLQQEYEQGVQAAKANEASTAYEHLEEALVLAHATDQEGAAQRIQEFLVSLPKQWGNDALEDEDYEQALEHFEKGIEHNEQEAYLHYGKGIALINMDQEEEAIESLTRAVEVGEETGDQSTAQTARERIQEHYVYLASEELNADNPTQAQATQAIEYLDEMEEYVEPNASAYFYRATALYHLNQFEDAIAAAQQGLELFDGSRSDAARYHFVIGESHVELDNIEEARQAFEQATYGDYRARAEHYLETL